MLTNNCCASNGELHRYLSGDMTEVRQQTVALHLEVCLNCQHRLAHIAGGDALWQEARDMLEDYHNDTGALERMADAPQRNDKKLSGIDAHLTHWMGPTDDPTKLGRIGHYEVIGIIGYGGAGVVLRAHDSRLNRPVAIKALLPALAHNPMARRRFERESRAVAAIVHQNVVPIYTVDIYNDHPYIAMQYVAGRSLQQRIDKEGALAVAEIVRVAHQIALALAAAHAQGIIHRDIKPANILLENSVDRAYVTDFGLARVVDDATTHSGMVTGTPQYMSPEQCHGNSVDHRTDLFSLGSVMYAMCTGQPPFRSQTLMGMLRKVCDCQPRNILDLNPDIPLWLQALVFRLLSKSAQDRFATASDVADILQRELAHLYNPNMIPIPDRQWMPSRQTTLPAIPFRSFSNHYRQGIFMTLSTILVGGLLAFLFLQDDGDASSKSPSPPVAQAAASSTSKSDWTAGSKDDERLYFESTQTESLPAKQGGQLTVMLNRGHVTVKSAEQEQVTVEQILQVYAANAEEAQRVSEGLKMKLTSNDGNVELNNQIESGDESTDDKPKYKSIEYVITVPKAYTILANTKGGHVSVEGIKGRCELVTSGGHIECTKLDGDAVLSTQGGHIAVSKVTGTATAKTAGGHIELTKIDGAVDAHTQGGHISGNKLGGDVKAETNGGHIELNTVSGNLELNATSGNVELKGIAGQIQANSNSGNMSVEFLDPVKNDSTISVGSGNVELTLPKKAAATVRAVINNGSFSVSSESTTASKQESDTQVTVIANTSSGSTSSESNGSAQIIHREFNGGGPGINVRVGSGRLAIEVVP